VTSAAFWPRRQDLPKDLSAGVTVALVSIAEGMAYALVAGVDADPATATEASRRGEAWIAGHPS
jgi:hypothetical protein